MSQAYKILIQLKCINVLVATQVKMFLIVAFGGKGECGVINELYLAVNELKINRDHEIYCKLRDPVKNLVYLNFGTLGL